MLTAIFLAIEYGITKPPDAKMPISIIDRIIIYILDREKRDILLDNIIPHIIKYFNALSLLFFCMSLSYTLPNNGANMTLKNIGKPVISPDRKGSINK